MEKLLEFYTDSLKKLAGAVVAAALLVPTVLIPYLEKTYPTSRIWPGICAGLTSGVVVGLVLSLGEWLIRAKLWKIVHPEFDFSGQWKGHTTYTHIQVDTTIDAYPIQIKPEEVADQDVRIEQDCLSIRLAPSEAKKDDFVFKSLAINILENGSRLAYAYHVEFKEGRVGRPPRADGYEWLDVLDGSKGKRPKVLKGKFAHCAAGQMPVLSGEVYLERKS